MTEGNVTFPSVLTIFEGLNNLLSNIDLKEFEALFKGHYAELCVFANKFLDDLDAAEETVQSVFVKIWEGKNTLSIQSSIKSYLYSAVRNGCMNQIKHIKIRDTYKTYNQRTIDEGNHLESNEVEVSELESKIQESIKNLPKSRRQIFILSRYEGLKYKEIAEQLNISIKTVENQMGSALKQLREDLVEYMPVLIPFLWILIDNYSKF